MNENRQARTLAALADYLRGRGVGPGVGPARDRPSWRVWCGLAVSPRRRPGPSEAFSRKSGPRAGQGSLGLGDPGGRTPAEKRAADACEPPTALCAGMGYRLIRHTRAGNVRKKRPDFSLDNLRGIV